MKSKLLLLTIVVLLTAFLASGLTFLWMRHIHPEHTQATQPINRPPSAVLYWYDPMQPDQHFDHPGKSPYMDMPLLPKYADSESASVGAPPGVKISADRQQSLGMRVGSVKEGTFTPSLRVEASVNYDDRDLAVVQMRTLGFVEVAYPHTAGDFLVQGAPLAKVRVPSWSAAQAEYLQLLNEGPQELVSVARERMLQLGMDAALVQQVTLQRHVQDVMTVRTPIAGVLLSYDIRDGMTVMQGQTLARINGISTVWLQASVPQQQAQQIRIGQGMEARIAGTGRLVRGHVVDILPALDAATHTLIVRMRVPDAERQLHPGMFAEVNIALTPQEHQLMVPSNAILETGERSIVFLALDKGRFEPVQVQVGDSAQGMTRVLRGLQAHDRIVLSGQFLVDSEANLADLPVRPLPGDDAPSPSASTSVLQGMPGMSPARKGAR